MSIAEIERFAADLQSNEALRAEAEKAEAGMSPETPLANAIAFAATKGYDFTADDMKACVRAGAGAAGKELTDAELGGVVGGSAAFQKYMDAQMRTIDSINAAMTPTSDAAALQGASQQLDAQIQAAQMSQMRQGIYDSMTQFVQKMTELASTSTRM